VKKPKPEIEAKKTSDLIPLQSGTKRKAPPLKFTNPDGQTPHITVYDNEKAAAQFLETTGSENWSFAERIIRQVIQAQPQASLNLELATTMLYELAPKDPIEGLLAAQMIAAHEMAMEFTRRAMVKDQSIEAVERNVNRSTKLMRTFVAQMEALNKYRNKGQQTIQVQHVNVNDGGQAIVGNINQGGGGYETKK
jgi:hypothetical protein